MPADFTNINAAIAQLTSQVAATEGIDASAVVLIEGFATAIQTAVAAALTADDAADSGSIAAASEAITGVTARFTASSAKVGAALAAHPTA